MERSQSDGREPFAVGAARQATDAARVAETAVEGLVLHIAAIVEVGAAGQFPGLDIPDVNLAVVAAAEELFAIGGPGERIEEPALGIERGDRPGRFHVPQ